MNFKSLVICNICRLVLNSGPISLPCKHAICIEHLRDGTVKDGLIQCLKCEQEFDVPQSGFPPHKTASDILDRDLYLSGLEKRLKHSIQATIQQLDELLTDLKQKHFDLERLSSDHFTEIRRQIDIHREELKVKIDEIALKLIDQTKEREKAFNSKLKDLDVLVDIDLAKCTQRLENEFRRPNVQLEEALYLKEEHLHKVAELEVKISEMVSFGEEIKSLKFKKSRELKEELLFGYLKSNWFIACALDNNIQIRHLDSCKFVSTLEAHSDFVRCLEKIDDNRFASGSDDKTVKIWDANYFVCLKTLITGHQSGISCLKSLPSNRLATGSFLNIKIWNIESGECMQTLNGHLYCIFDIVYLPNGNLVSCSEDKSIKMWDLDTGECLKSLTYNSGEVYCLVLLRNGHLASGSNDKAIYIWNLESDQCIQTLKGHTDAVTRLQVLESGELVSCSWDNTIRIWNVMEEGVCIRILNGHNACVRAIRLNSQDNSLLSNSIHGILKTWDLNTGECVNTTAVQKGAYMRDFILIRD